MNSKRSVRMKTTESKMTPRARIITFAVMAAVVLADQLTKLAAVKALVRVGASKTVIPGFLDFTYVQNSGATAGILANHRWIFMVVSTIVIIAIGAYIALGKPRGALMSCALAMVAGGGVGNMIDRVARGTVVDFIDVTAVDFFPFNTVFNVADTFVCAGCALLVLSVIINEIKENRGAKEDDAPTGE